MKTIINPNAFELNLTVRCDIQVLETEGWDFDSYHENTAEHYGITIEQARDRNYQEYQAEITIIGGSVHHGTRASFDPNTIFTYVSWYNCNRNENTEREETGDDKKTIEDICKLIDAGLITVNDHKDFTVDSDDKYTPTFIQETAQVCH